MRKFWNSNRGQIRGIDFALAMIIFLLTMSQLLILTNNFIESSRSHQSTLERQSVTNQIAFNFIYSTGSSSGTNNWVDLPTTQLLNSNWTFGLSNNDSIDPFKLGRMASNSLDEYYLSYDNISQALETNKKKFRIEIINPLNVSIDVVTNIEPLVQINGSVSLRGKPVYGTNIQTFIVAQNSGVAQGYTTSDNNGNFSIEIQPSDAGPTFGSNAYSIIAIANYGHFVQDVAYTTFLSNIPSSIATIFNATGNTGNVLNITAVKNDVNAIVTSLYVGTLGNSNFSSAILTQNSFNFWSNNTLGVPNDGMVVFVIHETDALGALTFSTIISFPIALDGELSDPIEPLILPKSGTSTVVITVRVRGLLMDLRFTTWK